MKKFIQTSGDVFLILIWTMLSMMAGGLWLDSWENNRWVLPLHDLLGPFLYLGLFLCGYHFLQKRRYGTSYISWPPRLKRRYFVYGIVLVVLCSAGGMLTGGRFCFPKLDGYLFAQNAAGLLGTFLIAPFIEETVFRGVILGQIAKRYGTTAGILISSLLFGAVHLMNGELDPVSMLQLVFSGTLMAILLSTVYLYEGTLWASIVVHALYNGLGSLIPLQAGTTDDWPVIFVLDSRNRILTGGEYGFDCSLISNLAYLALILFFLFLLRRKGSSLEKSAIFLDS